MQTAAGTYRAMRLSYLLHVPRGSAPENGWPLVLFLHGAGERGSDVWQVATQGPPARLDIDQRLRQSIVVSPQCPKEWWWDSVTLKQLLDEVLASQRKMMQNRGEGDDVAGGEDVPDAEMAALFARHVDQVQAWMAQQPNVRVLHIDYNALLTDPAPFVARVQDFLPFTLDTAAMTAVVDPDLYRNRRR